MFLTTCENIINTVHKFTLAGLSYSQKTGSTLTQAGGNRWQEDTVCRL